MSRDLDRTRLFTRRAVLLGAAKVGLFSLLAGRLYYLQVMKGEQFRTQAEENRINMRLIAPPRGQIADRTGAPLAVNQQNYRVVLLPEQVEKLAPLLDKLADMLALSEGDRKRIERDFRGNDGLNAVMVRDNLTWDQVAVISLHVPELSGVDIEVGEVRTYPYVDVTAHLVGYVGPVSQADMDKGRVDYAIPGFRIGKSGVEKQYDEALRGEPGTLELEVNARGRVVRELARSDPASGKDLRLTVDIGLQQMVLQRLAGEQSASAVVMDAVTGAIYALVSHPSFDPNLFTYGIGQQDWDRLNNDDRLPMLNKVMDGLYAPGSTFKIVTSLAALDAGLLNPKDTIFCAGHIELGSHRFHCWKKGGHGAVNFVQAMAGSCDCYFYEIGKRVGIDKLQAMARRLGLGEKTGIDFPHERAGIVPSRAWKEATRGASWQLGETLISAIGQGYLLVTPLQLCAMGARIANGGFAVRPHLTAAGASPRGESLGLQDKHLDLLKEALSAVVNQPIGTAYGARAANAEMTMAGKTGTAQVRRISSAERESGVLSNEVLAWKERDHALFVGFAPVQTPRYVAAVVVEHGGSGAHTTAPIVRDILLECQKRNIG